ncbi:MAG: signal recognition particle-docking protein FtsY [Halothiobacillaceae bacterium]|nr:MAG: signal recognition particle-docking protein FtsY [Halothiobacillaceae bacterium]
MFGFLRRFKREDTAPQAEPAEIAENAPQQAVEEPVYEAPALPPELEREIAATATAEAEAEQGITEVAVIEPPPDVAPAPSEPARPEPEAPGLWASLRSKLARTREGLTEGLASLVLGKKQIDDELLEDIETRLLLADVGMETTQEIIADLTRRVSRKELKAPEALLEALYEHMVRLLTPAEQPLLIDTTRRPHVILVVGINGAGKTTTIGKLGQRLSREGHKVMLAAGDTFRAAAVEQLQAWGERTGVPVIAQGQGADSAGVVFDALQAARARGMDVLIADTAGRLHTQGGLMEEVKKVKRVLAKLDPEAPHEVLLVLDASIGQNALNQAVQFNQALGVTGLAVTKLDGTAKGGILFAITRKLGLPIRFIGVGEKAEDLRPFVAREFVDALLDHES